MSKIKASVAFKYIAANRKAQRAEEANQGGYHVHSVTKAGRPGKAPMVDFRGRSEFTLEAAEQWVARLEENNPGAKFVILEA